jgi:hypothetical protein
LKKDSFKIYEKKRTTIKVVLPICSINAGEVAKKEIAYVSLLIDNYSSSPAALNYSSRTLLSLLIAPCL